MCSPHPSWAHSLPSTTILLLIAMITAPTVATTYFIDPANGVNQPPCGLPAQTPCRTVRLGLSIIDDGDVIQLLSGQYLLDDLGPTDINKAVNITGAGHQVVFDCQQRLGPVITLNATANLSDFTIRNCNLNTQQQYSSALQTSAGAAGSQISNVVIEACAPPAVYVMAHSDPHFRNLSLSRSRSLFTAEQCFGINAETPFMVDDASVTVEDSYFGSNLGCRGGAVAVVGGIFECVNCVFEQNTAFVGGGAVYVLKGAASFNKTHFVNNHVNIQGVQQATGAGGAIFVDQAHRILLSHTHFTNNEAVEGGAIYIHSQVSATEYVSPVLDILQSSFTANRATEGGALHISQTDATIMQSNFTANRALSDDSTQMGSGGAILFQLGGGGKLYGSLNVTSCTFAANEATVSAAAIRLYGSRPSQKDNCVFDSCVFDGNLILTNSSQLPNVPRQFKGYAVQVQSFVQNVIFRSVQFLSNRGGDLSLTEYMVDPKPAKVLATGVTLEACIFKGWMGCTAEESMLLIQGPFAPVINGTTFVDYSCAAGVAVTFRGPVTRPHFSNCQFLNNTVHTQEGGAALGIMASSGQLDNCTFANNRADEGGSGAVLVSAGSTTLFKNCLFVNNHAIEGGAVHADSASPRFESSVFIGNGGPSTTAGGAITFTGPVSPALVGCHFENNSALYGGAVFLAARSYCTVSDCTFVRNLAGREGGAIYLEFYGTRPTISSSEFVENQATDMGGAVMIRSGAKCTFTNTLFGVNYVTSGMLDSLGPAVCAVQSPAAVFDSCNSKSAISVVQQSNCTISNSSISLVSLGASSSIQVNHSAVHSLASVSATPTCSSRGLWRSVAVNYGTSPICSSDKHTARMPFPESGADVAFMALSFSLKTGSSETLFQTSHVSDEGDMTGIAMKGGTVNTSSATSAEGVIGSCSEVHQTTCDESWSEPFWIIIVSCSTVLLLLVGGAAYGVFIFRRDWMVVERPGDVSDSDSLTPLMIDDGGYESFGGDSVSFDYFGYGIIDHRELWLHDVLGSGTFGVVRKATLRRRHRMKARYVAVKELLTEDSQELIEEAKTMFDIPTHENVVGLIGLTEAPPFLVTELVEGCEMLDVHLRRQRETAENYLEVVHQAMIEVANGVAHLHQHSLMHRDLAARNILVDMSGRCLVNDFGLSRLCTGNTKGLCVHCGEDPTREVRRASRSSFGSSSQNSTQQEDYELSGTAQYYRAAPENFDYFGVQIHTIQSDVFMFGSIMWQAVTGIWAGDLTSSLEATGFWSCFDEGKGLVGYDITQQTRAAKPRVSKSAQYGLVKFTDVLNTAREESKNQTLFVCHPDYANSLGEILMQTLQHKQADRPEMHTLHRRLVGLKRKGSHTVLTPRNRTQVVGPSDRSPRFSPNICTIDEPVRERRPTSYSDCALIPAVNADGLML